MLEETAATLKNGYLLATRDEDGYLYIVDRKRDMITAKGCHVCPRDVDEVLYKNPKVQEACYSQTSHRDRIPSGVA